jgi:hypothetical protein
LVLILFYPLLRLPGAVAAQVVEIQTVVTVVLVEVALDQELLDLE